MAKYLDANGVKYLWSKIKDNFWAKSDLDTTFVEVVDNLPTEGIKRCLYLKATAVEGDNNKYEEYIYIGDLPISGTNPYDATKWEKLGEYKAEVDLTPYAKKSEAVGGVSDVETDETSMTIILSAVNNADLVDIPLTPATTTDAGVMTAADKTKLNGLEESPWVKDGNGIVYGSKKLSSNVLGDHAVVCGEEVAAAGKYSIAEGSGSTANGDYSHAEGSGKAYGDRSHAEGLKTIAEADYSHAEGRYNVANENALHSRGVGYWDTSAYKYKKINSEYTYYNPNDDADTKNGNIYFLGVGGYDGMSTDATTYSSVQEVINNLQGSVLGSAEVDARDNRLDIALYDSNEEPNALAEVSLPMATATTLGVVKLADTSQGVSVDDKGVMTASDYVNAIVYSQVGSGVVTAEASDVNIALYGLAHKEGEKLCSFTLPAASATASGVMTAAMYAALPVEGALSNDEIDAAIA